MANLDVENMPKEKEARFKEQIITGRIQKTIAKWKVGFGKFFGFIGGNIARLFNFIFHKLQESKKNYSRETAPILAEDKGKRVAELFLKIDNLDDRENFEEKEAELIKIIELEPRNPQAFITLGSLYLANKKYEEAKQAFIHALKLSGNEETDRQAEIYHDLADVYLETGELADSLETIKMAAKLSPNSPRHLDSLLEISIINKDKTTAADAWEKLAAVNPENGKLADFKEQIEELE